MKYVLLTVIVALQFATVDGQSDYQMSEKDSLAIIDELKKDLASFYGDDQSYADISAGVGNGYFSPRSAQAAPPANSIFYTGNAAYFHKSGFSLSSQFSFVNDKAGFTLFQTALSPSYDYTKGKKWGFGTSFTHYFNKDSLSFYTSPLVNEVYGYARYKKGWLQPTLGIVYGFGSPSDITRQQAAGSSSATITSVSDLSVIASARHDFSWQKIFCRHDGFALSPTILAVAGTSKYGTTIPTGSSTGSKSGGAVRRTVSKFMTKNEKKTSSILPLPILNNNNNNNQSGNGNTTTTTTTTTSTDFQMQSLSFLLSAQYFFGSFYLQPQVYVDYTLPDVSNKWTSVFNCSIGITF